MSLFDGPVSGEELPLEHALIQLVDDYAQFASVNAYLLSSMTQLLSSGNGLNQTLQEEVIAGAMILSEAVQLQVLEIKKSLYLVLKQYRVDDSINQ